MPHLLFLAIFLLTACTFVSEPIAVTRIPAATAVPPTPTPALLAGTEWKLTEMNGRSPLASSQITLIFANGTAGGFAGCNSYGGPINAPGDGTFAMTEIALTSADCAGPEGVMVQEAAFVEMLAQITSYHLRDDQLEMANAAGETTLVFTKVERFDMNPAALIGTTWQLQAWGNRELLPGTETITLIFDSAGEMSGFAGCRHYQGSYFAENDAIRFPSLRMIEESCPLTDDFLIQEGDFTTALSQTTRYRLQDGQLELFTAPGEVLLFMPLALDEQSMTAASSTPAFPLANQDMPQPADPPTPTLTAESGLWLVTADGTTKLYFGRQATPFWLDAEDLVYTVPIEDSLRQQVYNLATGEQHWLDLPAGAIPIRVER